MKYAQNGRHILQTSIDRCEIGFFLQITVNIFVKIIRQRVRKFLSYQTNHPSFHRVLEEELSLPNQTIVGHYVHLIVITQIVCFFSCWTSRIMWNIHESIFAFADDRSKQHSSLNSDHSIVSISSSILSSNPSKELHRTHVIEWLEWRQSKGKKADSIVSESHRVRWSHLHCKQKKCQIELFFGSSRGYHF